MQACLNRLSVTVNVHLVSSAFPDAKSPTHSSRLVTNTRLLRSDRQTGTKQPPRFGKSPQLSPHPSTLNPCAQPTSARSSHRSSASPRAAQGFARALLQSGRKHREQRASALPKAQAKSQDAAPVLPSHTHATRTTISWGDNSPETPNVRG